MHPFDLPTFDQCDQLTKEGDAFVQKTEEVHGVPITSFKYRLASYSDFCKPYARNLRGITFRKDTKELLAAPFWKFFNYGENPFTLPEVVAEWSPIAIHDKLDGSLVYFYLIDGKLCAKTKFDCYAPQAQKALEFVNSFTRFANLIYQELDDGYTPMFEWISPDNQIVLPYKMDELVYLGSRSMKDGKLRESLPKGYGSFMLPKHFSNSIEEILTDCTKGDGELKEGYVVRFDNGDLVKFKTRKYLDVFHLVSSVNSGDKYIANLTLNDQIDDILPIIPDVLKERVITLSNKVRSEYNAVIRKGEEFYEQNKHLDRKEFALKALEELGKGNEMSVAMGKMTGKFNEETFKMRFVANESYKDHLQ